jgi:hypothetical protein
MRSLIGNWLWLLVFAAFALGFITGGWSASNEAPAQKQTERSNSASSNAEAKTSTISQLHSERDALKPEDKQKAWWSWIGIFLNSS